ncbi:MAG: hypothetical protein ABIP81_03525 [Terriglobales bacterium]
MGEGELVVPSLRDSLITYTRPTTHVVGYGSAVAARLAASHTTPRGGGQASDFGSRRPSGLRIKTAQAECLCHEIEDKVPQPTTFLREIKVLAGLKHPNIATLHTAFTIDNQLVMISRGRLCPMIFSFNRVSYNSRHEPVCRVSQVAVAGGGDSAAFVFGLVLQQAGDRSAQ